MSIQEKDPFLTQNESTPDIVNSVANNVLAAYDVYLAGDIDSWGTRFAYGDSDQERLHDRVYAGLGLRPHPVMIDMLITKDGIPIQVKLYPEPIVGHPTHDYCPQSIEYIAVKESEVAILTGL